MKRFLLFTYDECYPSGGMLDFKGDFESQEEAKKFHTDKTDYYHIYDLVKKQIVETNDNSDMWWKKHRE